jgi:hypothetical protein
MKQKIKQQRFLKYLWHLHTSKKLILGHLLRPDSGSDGKGPVLTGSATLILHMMI